MSFSWLIRPFELALAWIMVRFHDLFTFLGMDPAGGWTWVLSIVGMVFVVRTLMIPLFVKQIQSSRRTTLAQPEIMKIRKKYDGKKDPASRQAMAAEMQEVYRTHGNPLAGCLPVLVQMPVLFALMNVLNNLGKIADGTRGAIGPLTKEVAAQAESSSIFGAQLSATFLRSDALGTKILAAILVILMTASTFYAQRQMMTLNMPDTATDNPMYQQQKMLMYILPVVFGVSGIGFPIGVLIYWFVSNIWTTVQQFYVIHQMPSPGTEAERRLNERRARKGLPPVKVEPLKRKPRLGAPAEDSQAAEQSDSDATSPESVQPIPGKQRIQPQRKKRRNR